MALFFKTFRHCDLSDHLGIPTFPLSRNGEPPHDGQLTLLLQATTIIDTISPCMSPEKRHQAKYNDDESTLSECSSISEEKKQCSFRRLDENRERRKSVFMQPNDIQSDHSTDTAKR